ncbi:hypothetical protein T440DRAFT_398669 [Plenodomus tracheiphilus IPT5]|uniref:Uncharacterized protein n=1 Tax=Plenodomus tracheiphilus IPT5 TaxID=1408161 RepID=A0A6A7B2C8_9PLEO|nr:hypothetical protein T440DRAFT_398669 [Plenodomus tracheiphilus IPT5]
MQPTTLTLTLLLANSITVTATPFPFAAASPQAIASASASAIPNKKGNHTHTHHHHHKEPTPTFRQPCKCQMPVVPVNLLSVGEKCPMEHAAAMGCWLGSKGGCPSPAPACGLGPLKGIPLDQ